MRTGEEEGKGGGVYETGSAGSGKKGREGVAGWGTNLLDGRGGCAWPPSGGCTEDRTTSRVEL